MNSMVRSLAGLPPTVPYFVFIPAVILYIIQSQKQHMSYVDTHQMLPSYDYVVIGAGTGGSVMASRLSENPNRTVLLLEAGGPEWVISDIPRMALLLQQTPIDWQFKTIPQNKSCRGLRGRRSLWPRGRVMGGSSVLNTMIYSRGNRRDYDHWASQEGAVGWSWADLFPYFIKAENNMDPTRVASGYHGRGGPLTVSNELYTSRVSQAFKASGPYVGYPIGSSTGATQSVFEFPQVTIVNGERMSVARAYLEPVAGQRPNLHIFTKSFVTKILFDCEKRATGVEFVRWGVKRVVRVDREVIVSAGAVMSPKLLMLSGIGHRAHLASLNVPVLSDRPVGDNLMDHVATSVTFTLNESVSYDVLRESSPWHVLQYYVNKDNSLSSTILDTMAFVKTKYANQTDDWPDIQYHVLPGSVASDYGLRLRKIQGLTDELFAVFKPYSGLPAVTILPTLLRPQSRGTVRLRSANPFQHPAIDPQFFAVDHDLDVLVEGMKLALAIARAPPLQRYNATPIPDRYPTCDQQPLYSDAYLRCTAQVYTSIIFHPMGTCRMGPIGDPRSVVDLQLRVVGVTGVRVVDASVIPAPVSGNINAPIVAIAEKCADTMRGRRLRPMTPPMSATVIANLPHLPYDAITANEDNTVTDWSSISASFTGQTKGEQPVDINEKCLQLCQKYLSGVWTQLTADRIRTTRLTGGLTNQLYLCEIIDKIEGQKQMVGREADREGDREVVNEVAIRLYGKKYDNKSFDPQNPRFNDTITAALISSLGIGPRLYGLDPSGQVLQYVKHRPFDRNDLNNSELMDQLGRQLARFHAIRAPIRRDRCAHLNYMAVIAAQMTEPVVKELRELYQRNNGQTLDEFDLKGEIQWVLNYIGKHFGDSPLVFGHNDFRGSNIMVTDKGLVLCDFDYSAYAHRGFDFGLFFSTFLTSDDNFEDTFPLEPLIESFVKNYLNECQRLSTGGHKCPDVQSMVREVKVFVMFAYLLMV
ncbi:unnamed protein product, partial [Medioppia subpectinata]